MSDFTTKAFAYEESEENEQQKLGRYQINSYSIDRAIETLIKWKKNNKLIVPEFQREFVWTYSNCCRLIDSILLNLPIPNIFVFKVLNEEIGEQYLLVDGMQRITTIEQFFDGEWKQSEKERSFKINIKSSNWYKKDYESLGDADQEFFKDYPINVTIFEASASSRVKSNNVIFSVFERINTGSEKLTEQEIRNTIYQGDCLDALKDFCSTGNSFNSLISNDSKIQKRGKNIEFILRILTYYEIFELSSNEKEFLVEGEDESKITTSKTVMLNNYLYYANQSLLDYTKKLGKITEALEIIESIDITAFYSVKRDHSGIGNKVHQVFSEALVISVIENDYKVLINKDQLINYKKELWRNEDFFYATFAEKTTDPAKVINRVKLMIRFINGEKIWEDSNGDTNP